MGNLILIFLALLIGILLQRLKALPKDMHISLNVIILYVCLPAMTILSIPTLKWSFDLAPLILVSWLIFGFAYFFFSYLGKKFHWEQSLTGCLILTAGLGNTSFVGLPIIEAALGKDALKFALLLDQAGTFVVCSTFGLWVATLFSQGIMTKKEMMKKFLVFPPFVSFAIAVCLSVFNIVPHGWSQVLLERLANMLAPLALVSVGLQLKPKEIKEQWRPLSWGLGFKLILAPMVIYGLFFVFNLLQTINQVAILEAAMPPMMTASILASSYGLRPGLAGLMVGVGVPLSFLSLFLWYQLI